ncbi:unnamed protein product, partial [Adineta ricciae]
ALQGGLSIFLKWISPNITQITMNIYYYYQKQRRKSIVQPSLSNETIFTLPIDTSIDNTTTHSESIRCTFKMMIIICIWIMLVITSLVFFSMHFPRQDKDQTPLKINVTTETNSSLTVVESICEMKFEIISRKIKDTQPILPVIADLNNDHQLDLVFYCVQEKHLYVLLSNGRGTFQQELFFPIKNVDSSIKIVAADFNNDHQVDLAVTNSIKKCIHILFGYGNGSFRSLKTVSLLRDGTPSSIAVTDFDNDNYTDIVVLFNIDKKMIFFFGMGNGKFSRRQFMSVNWPTFYSKLIHTVDMNRDGYKDILVWDSYMGNIDLMIGSGTKLDRRISIVILGKIWLSHLYVGVRFICELDMELVVVA